MNVLSLFDGMSCGQLALQRAGIKVDKYYASEIDKAAMSVTMHNFPNTIQLGDINEWRSWINVLDTIHVIMAGSPCQDLSRIKSKDGKGLEGAKSKLFYTFVDILQHVKPPYFLLENVVMDKSSHHIIDNLLGVKGVLFNSKTLSAQDRPRIYWTNIPYTVPDTDSPIMFEDIMEQDIPDKYWLNDEFEEKPHLDRRMAGVLHKRYPNGKVKYTETTSRVYNPGYKMACLTAVCGGGQHKKVYDRGRPRRLTPTEYERLQTVPDGYTETASDSQRYKMLGNGWTVDVITHILTGIKKKSL
jgi:DNA-cytosine methyltransferase